MKRGLSVLVVETKAGLSPNSVESLEAGNLDPSASMLTSIADVFGVPVSWLYGDPGQLDALAIKTSEARPDSDGALDGSVDPVIENILRAKPAGRNLFHLLAVLIHNGDEKQLRAAEINLRSLIKQNRISEVPWENRQTGNFEPPSD